MSNEPSADSQMLSSPLKWLLVAAAIIDLVLGIIFFIGPETGWSVWPSDVPPLLSRLVGAIVIASGVGVLVAARQGTWTGARALFAVGWVYGALALVALLYHLLVLGAPGVFWLYAGLAMLYLAVISYVIWAYEFRGG